MFLCYLCMISLIVLVCVFGCLGVFLFLCGIVLLCVCSYVCLYLVVSFSV